MADFDGGLIGANRVHSAMDIAKLPSSTEVVYVVDLDNEKFAALTRLKDLRDLISEGADKLTDSGLAEIRRLPKLQTLDLEGASGLTDKVVDYLMFVSSLKSLNVRGCTGISRDGMWRLTSALFGCEVDADAAE